MPPRTPTTILSHRTLFPSSRLSTPACGRSFPSSAVSSQQTRNKSNANSIGPSNRRSEGNFRFRGKTSGGDSRIGSQQSTLTRNKEGMKKNIPNDLGLLPGTLVMPTGSDVPSFFSSPAKRTKMLYGRLDKRFRDFISVIYYKYQQTPRLKIHFRQTAPTAAALHRQMYTALAEGDLPTISPLLCEGIRSQFNSRLASRRPGTRYAWTLHRYTSSPRVVSHRATILPIDDGSGSKPAVRQAVVQIKSVQSLKLVDERGQAVKAAEDSGEVDVVEKEVTEYVVVQRRVWKGVEERWRVWGTVEETKMDKWEETLKPDMFQERAVAG